LQLRGFRVVQDPKDLPEAAVAAVELKVFKVLRDPSALVPKGLSVLRGQSELALRA
jgi:hypothetical protein